MNIALAGHLKPCRKWNADATTVRIDKNATGSLVCLIDDETTKNGPVHSINVPSDPCIFIKWMNMCSAAGDLSDLVLIVAVDGLTDDNFLPVRVRGLSSMSGNTQFGWILFCLTRGGNAVLWKWWFEAIAIPTMVQSKATDVSSF
jgi:hypothetical protein